MDFSSVNSNRNSMQNYSISKSSPINILREEQEEKSKLEKSNFDLKMKVYYLEESLKRYQDGEDMNDSQSINYRIEIDKLKLLLEDKQVDLEQRNLLLMKSKNAIEALKTEIERLRLDNEHHYELEDRFRRLKQVNEDIEKDSKNQILHIETQLNILRKSIETKDKERLYDNDKINQLEISLQHLEYRLKNSLEDKDKLNEQYMISQNRIKKLEEDLLQEHAHVELYQIQTNESNYEKDNLIDKLRQEQIMKLKIEEEFKEKLLNMNIQYDQQILKIRSNHEQDLENLRHGNLEMLSDVRDSYQSELNRTKSDLERHLNEIKKTDALEYDRTVNNYNLRIDEKNDEIRSLRSLLTSESERSNGLMQELELMHKEFKGKSQHSESLMLESAMKSEELKIVPKLALEIEDSCKKIVALQDQLKLENIEKNQLKSKLELAIHTSDSIKNALKDCENTLQSANFEIQRLSKEIIDQTNKADGVEFISRENERLKNNIAKLETELLMTNHKVSDLKKDLDYAHEEHQKITSERESFKETSRMLTTKLETIQSSLDTLQIQYQNEKERRSAAESALQETRSVLLQTRDELQDERNVKNNAENLVLQLDEDTKEMKKTLGAACVMCYHAMNQWDDTLAGILDGDIFESIAQIKTRAGGSTIVTSSSTSNNRYTPIKGSGSSGGVSMNLLVSNHKEEAHTDLLDASMDQLLQRVVISIERVDLKLQRTQKIRTLFVSQTEKLVVTLQEGVQSGHEKVSLYHHKLTESQLHLQHLKEVVHRDIKQRDDEMQEIKHFKEVVISQHATQIRDSELRYVQLSQLLEHEKQRSTDLQNQVASQSEQIRSLQHLNERMQEDLEHLQRTEKIVSDLSYRITEIGEMNRSLLMEVESKSYAITHLTNEHNELLLEKDSFVKKSDLLLNKLRSKEDAILESERKLEGFVREIERLRTRQIHPDLAQTILETQNILQSAVRHNNNSTSSSASNIPTTSNNHLGLFTNETSSTTTSPLQKKKESIKVLDSVSDILNSFMSHVQQLEDVSSDLIRRTSDMIVRFENHMASTRSTRSTAAVAELKQEIYDLLDANSRISIQIQQVTSDLKKGMRQLNMATKTTMEVINTSNYHDHHNSNHHHHPNNSNEFYSPGQINIEDLRIDSHQHTKPPTFSPTAAMRMAVGEYQQYHSGNMNPTSSNNISNVNHLDNYSMNSTTTRSNPSLYSPMQSKINQLTTTTVHSTPNSTTSFQPYATQDLNMQQQSISSYKNSHTVNDLYQQQHNNNISKNTLVMSSTYSNNNYTPNTASRTSTNRINKLSSELELLAKKLDSYDNSRSK